MMQPPQPDPIEIQELDEDVDWMSYSHQQLYDMVNNGVDLTGATDISASWAQLSDTLIQMSSTLSAALAASTDGWQGQAADQARGNLTGLVNWTNTTGENAVIVSGCVTRQADALQVARSSMPVPPPSQPVATPATPATPATAATTTSAFAQPPIATPGPITTIKDSAEAHQQAARVMQQYQSSSADIARTIPQFAAPTSPVNDPTAPPTGNPVPPPGSAPPTGTGPVGGVGKLVPGTGAPAEEEGGLSRIGSTQPNPASRASAGSGVANESEPAQGTRSSTMSGGGMGGAGGRRDTDQEHRRKYWQADDGLFDVDTRVTPRVIGEEKRG